MPKEIQNLSITSFGYIQEIEDKERYLNKLNETLVNKLHQGESIHKELLKLCNYVE